MKSDNIRNYEYVSKLTGIEEKEEKRNQLNIRPISYLAEYVSLYGLPKIKIRRFVAIYKRALK